jgi:hypothetical protein
MIKSTECHSERIFAVVDAMYSIGRYEASKCKYPCG